MTKARDLANIITGGFTADDIPNIPASKITSGQFADARIADLSATKLTGSIADARIPASAVSQHATSFDDNKIVNDISTLAIRQASNENKGAYNTNSMYVDVFQDSTGITNLTNTVRDSNEFLSSVSNQIQYGLPMGAYHSGMTIANGGWTGSVANDELTSSASYIGGYFDVLFDLSEDFLVKGFYTNSSGGQLYKAYGIYTALITTDTSVSAGANPTIFQDKTSTNYPHPNLSPANCSHWLTSSYYSTLGVSGITDNYNNGSSGSAQTVNCGSDTTINGRGYAQNNNFWGVRAIYDRSANTIDIAFSSSADFSSFVDRGKTQFTNVPSTGRFMMTFGHDTNGADSVSGTYASAGNSNLGTYGTLTTNATGSFESNTITAPSSTNKMGAIITYQDFAGTNALNTDFVLKLSADGGSNYATATMTAMPDFSSGIKMAKVNDLSVTAGTQLKYKISFANQSSGSKEARIRGVSLQY